MSDEYYKAGCNYSDLLRIKALAADGCGAEEISNILRVKVGVIENFMPETEEKPKRKRRTKAEMEAESETTEE